MPAPEQSQSLFDLTREMLDILWKADKTSVPSMVLAAFSGVGAVKTYVESKDTLQRHVKRMGLEEEYTSMRSFLSESLIKMCGHPNVEWTRGDTELHKFDLAGTCAYFVKAKNEIDVQHGVYVTDKEQFRRTFRRLFWEKQGGNAVTLLTRKHRWSTFIVPHPWLGEAGDLVGKHTPDTLLGQLQPFMDRGVGCTLIVAGPWTSRRSWESTSHSTSGTTPSTSR